MVPRVWQEAPWFGINEWARWMNETYQWPNDEMDEWGAEQTSEWTCERVNEWGMKLGQNCSNLDTLLLVWYFVLCVVVQVQNVPFYIC
jgi:hypothetical protein